VLAEKTPVYGHESQFTSEEYFEKSRSGGKSSLTINDMGLSTVIGKANKDASGNSISGGMKQTLDRLRIWDDRSKSNSTDRSLKKAFLMLNAAKSKISISDMTVENAAYIYRKIQAKKMTRGRSVTAMVLAALYLACRETKTPRTLQDISDIGNVSVKYLSKHVRILIKTLELRIDQYDSAFFVNRISNAAGISEKTTRHALEFLSEAKQSGFAFGKNPTGLAATILYLACISNNERLTQKKIALASGISIVTIRNRSMSLAKSLGIKQLNQIATA
jgi:transcription initiation factor TFIIB